MQNIINFFLKNRYFFLFLVLLILSLFFTIRSHSYHKSKFINSANWVTGGLYETANGISGYFGLKKYNRQLVEENRRLRNLLFNRKHSYPDSIPDDSLLLHRPAVSDSTLLSQVNDSMVPQTRSYVIRNASVIKNSYHSLKNYLTIDKGKSDSISQDMGVITSNGIVGIIDNTSGHYATVQSVLNTLTRINAQLKKTNHFGTLKWNGVSENIVQLIDISRIAPIQEGDTIITGGMSTIFPKGIPIGTIKNYALDSSENYYIINVELFNDMTNLGHVYIIENTNKDEILELEQSVNE
ncbi:rod shape-determining protein MreC [Sinomicrobium weinanense]|uniref:Cell shape-determining protein MreC n=1 Tax=Sinomicrobium weinanense TaxID=2842200 RepID=A0A926JUE6_9FLAO|nr:rod shape-determining protein MreC [Sinomicrobium weinanense]MBC9797728.1 rod shape-determining protein MreC [Sinomicrobium weinanense]MBU3123619.1 rod shape-determining protein MreC [Sinomicrobium weinanense]